MSAARPKAVLLAWGVHVFTASGAVLGVAAAVAVMDANWTGCFWLLIAATSIDAVDGMLARKARVREVLPGFDGALLDNLVDYLTYVIVPALFVCRAEVIPEGWRLAAAALMTLSSAYQFCQSDAKTEDHYFKGWPSYWNVLVFYLFLLKLPAWLNFALVVLCAVLVFVPVKYVYPSRTVVFRVPTLVLTSLWGVALIAMLLRYPQVDAAVAWGSLLYVLYYAVLSIVMTIQRASSAGAT